MEEQEDGAQIVRVELMSLVCEKLGLSQTLKGPIQPSVVCVGPLDRYVKTGVTYF